MEVGQAVQLQRTETPDASRIWHAAREFEALLLANLLGPLERTFSAISGEEQMAGSEAYQSLGMQAVATTLANQGGIGVADMIARSLMQSESHGKGEISLKFSGGLPMEQTGQSMVGHDPGKGRTVKDF